jgi:Uma2 family endonuclease
MRSASFTAWMMFISAILGCLGLRQPVEEIKCATRNAERARADTRACHTRRETLVTGGDRRMLDRMALPRKKPATYDDVLAAPEHLVAEIVDDELYLSPRPASPHAVALSTLGAELITEFGFGRAGNRGGWVILNEPELHIVGQIMVPDLAGWRRERMPEIPSAPYFTLAPDWLCEVVSPSTGALDRAKKLPKYARAGVGHVWLVDPTPKTLEIYRLDGDGWRLAATHEGDAVVNVPPFEAHALELGRLWAR